MPVLSELFQVRHYFFQGRRFGQRRPPLTELIRTILERYPDTAQILKELIQNADDAGATEVKFLYDDRHYGTQSLESPALARFQGPALYCYNNAIFREEDWDGIQNLMRSNKKDDPLKVGRFGIGFNSIYHITDLPGVVSVNTVGFFDPHEKYFAHGESGQRYDIRDNLLDPYSRDQFLPFHGLFGCNLAHGETYDATLFRFPLRTEPSDLSNKAYTEEMVFDLFQSLREEASRILLFLKNVQLISVHRRKENVSEMECVLKVELPVNTRKEVEMKQQYLQRNAARLEVSKCSYRMSVEVTFESKVQNFCWWVVNQIDSRNQRISELSDELRLLPWVGIAVPFPEVEPVQCGEAFCFLPLSIATGLPVHVNGHFALSPNRTGIWERDMSSPQQQIEVQWNESLMEDVLANAYIQLLQDMKSLSAQGYLKDCTVYQVWPTYSTLHSAMWEKLVKSVYDRLMVDALPLFWSDYRWLTINQGHVLSESLGQITPKIIEILRAVDQHVFELPPKVSISIRRSRYDWVIRNRTLTFKTFLQRFALPNIRQLSRRHRDAVQDIVCFGLDCILQRKAEDIAYLLKESPCIAVSTDGSHLSKPRQLIDPNGAAASLFSEEDRRFPSAWQFRTQLRAHVLQQLGMIRDKLSWRDILERARSVENFAGLEQKRQRARNMINYLKENMRKLDKPDSNQVSGLQNTKFLPIMTKPPDGYFLPWKGSGMMQFATPANLFLPSDIPLVGSSCLISDCCIGSECDTMNPAVERLLGFSERRPRIELVTQQLDTAIKTWTTLSDAQKRSKEHGLMKICRAIYGHFEDFLAMTRRSDEEDMDYIYQLEQNDEKTAKWLVSKLLQTRWLFIQGQFVSNEQVAYSWEESTAPFLYGLPAEYRRHTNLFDVVGVKKSFHDTDFIRALNGLQEMKAGAALTDKELKVALCFARQIENLEEDDVRDHVGQIPLPDTQKLLRRSEDLTVNEGGHLEDQEEVSYVHPSVEHQLALRLGVKSLLHRKLDPYASNIGMEFGQHEKLTDRLRNILDGYTCDAVILKELVQNADDAQATEIHFIHDTRVLPAQGVFFKNAGELQGQALCVYNNRPFTRQDMEGIQRLGIGSKRDDPEKTGRYGIGFNAVYNLTDCPSLLSNEETLCFFDPHCRYVPGASDISPGRKFEPIDEKFKKDYPNILPGYLGEYFQLKGATLFRLPLRTPDRVRESQISQTDATKILGSLLESFQREAKKMLLFLNNVTKISVSVVQENGDLVNQYEVTSKLATEDEKYRQQLSSFMKENQKKPTDQIPRKGYSYPMVISDSKNVLENWLVHQCCGVESESGTIPNGQGYGLFPRGGVAARMQLSGLSHGELADQPRYVAYCFLPLPSCYTSLPVHVNGHFVLNPSRRNLWKDEDPDGFKTRWNKFMMSRVLAPGYAALILEAQKYIPHCKQFPEQQRFFENEEMAKQGLSWYHNLFPDPYRTHDDWKVLAIAVCSFLGQTMAPVLPVLVGSETVNDEDAKKLSQRIQSWLPPQRAFFKDNSQDKEDLFKLLIRIGLPVSLFSPLFIHSAFQSAGITSRVVSPESVISHLQTFRDKDSACEIGELPENLEDTRVRTVAALKKLISYCEKKEEFGSMLTGLPLLLTADGQLKLFENPVYCSKFGDLFPKRAHLFVHPKFVSTLRRHRESSSEILRKFTVESLAEFMSDVFSSQLIKLAAQQHLRWSFRKTGVLSDKWFERLWEFLEDCAKYSHKTPMSLDALSSWPIIPTTCGKLVTVKNAKTVLDMSESGTETAREKKIRKFLEKAKCPTLSKAMTFKKSNARPEDTTSGEQSKVPSLSQRSKLRRPHQTDVEVSETTTTTGVIRLALHRQKAVTDPYVSHPHCVADVLQVLDYVNRTTNLAVSMFSEKEIFELLQFIQDDYENLEPRCKYDKILKDLPFYKTIDRTHVRLSAFSSYAIVPDGVPLAEIKHLQSHTGCLFLHSDALPSLTTLYQALGAGAESTNADEFYMKFIIPHFDVFRRESQLKFLCHIKEKFLSTLLQCDEHKELLTSLKNARCIPDENGNLHCATEFFDPHNKVFRIMFDGCLDKFPPPPFNQDEWLDFLSLIGLQKEVSEDQFLNFCREVASRSCVDEVNVRRSKQLVKYLLSEDHNHLHRDERFLDTVSRIKFIAAEQVEDDLSRIHDQYGCSRDQQPPFVQFRDSVPWTEKELVWTNATLLPHWAQPKTKKSKTKKSKRKKSKTKKNLGNLLGIQRAASVAAVVQHLQTISSSLEKDLKGSSVVIKSIMTSIYKFLSERSQCLEEDPSPQCSKVCKDIGHHLKEYPCVFLENEGLFVKGEKLSFSSGLCNDKFSPFLFAVPRDYGHYQHLLKRLGATETLSPRQMVNMLSAMKEQCRDEEMHDDNEKKARCAMSLFFSLIVEDQRGMEQFDSRELFLPSQDKVLVTSNELIYKVPPHLVRSVPKLKRPVLLQFQLCGLSRERESDYINALPVHLRPAALDDLVCEELEPSCQSDTCQQRQDGPICSFLKRYTELLSSSEFYEGILRLVRHQRGPSVITEEVKEKCARLTMINSSRGTIKCMNNVTTHLVDRHTGNAVEGTSANHIAHVVKGNDTWTLYVCHEFGGKNTLGLLSKSVNDILDGCLEERHLAVLTDMLMCESPTDIPNVLDNHDIHEDLSEENMSSFLDDFEKDIESSRQEIKVEGDAHGISGSGGGSRSGGGRSGGGSGGGGGGGGSSSGGSSGGIYGGGGGIRDAIPDTCFYPKSLDEANRWLQQSRRELEAAKFLLSSNPSFNFLVCFLSHQVVEKSLKAVLFARCGLTGEQLGMHNVRQLASDVSTEIDATQSITALAARVEHCYLETRYPNRQPPGRVPAEAFSDEDARAALDAANKLLKSIID